MPPKIASSLFSFKLFFCPGPSVRNLFWSGPKEIADEKCRSYKTLSQKMKGKFRGNRFPRSPSGRACTEKPCTSSEKPGVPSIFVFHKHRGPSEHQTDRSGPRPSRRNDFLHLAGICFCWLGVLTACGAYAKQTPVPQSPRQVPGLVSPQAIPQALDRLVRVPGLEARLALQLERFGLWSRPAIIRIAAPARTGPADL